MGSLVFDGNISRIITPMNIEGALGHKLDKPLGSVNTLYDVTRGLFEVLKMIDFLKLER